MLVAPCLLTVKYYNNVSIVKYCNNMDKNWLVNKESSDDTRLRPSQISSLDKIPELSDKFEFLDNQKIFKYDNAQLLHRI